MIVNYRWLFVLLFIGIIAISPTKAQDSTQQTLIMTFDQALEIARQNSHSIKQTHYLQQEKQQLSKASKGLYMPHVGVTASYMVMSDDLTLDLTPVRDAITPLYSALGNYGVFAGVPNPDPATSQAMPVLPQNISTEAIRGKFQEGLAEIQSAEWDRMIQKKEFGTVAATMMWPLYAGGKIHAANKAAGLELQEAEETMRQKEGELMSELVERYFGLSLADAALTFRYRDAPSKSVHRRPTPTIHSGV